MGTANEVETQQGIYPRQKKHSAAFVREGKLDDDKHPR